MVAFLETSWKTFGKILFGPFPSQPSFPVVRAVLELPLVYVPVGPRVRPMIFSSLPPLADIHRPVGILGHPPSLIHTVLVPLAAVPLHENIEPEFLSLWALLYVVTLCTNLTSSSTVAHIIKYCGGPQMLWPTSSSTVGQHNVVCAHIDSCYCPYNYVYAYVYKKITEEDVVTSSSVTSV